MIPFTDRRLVLDLLDEPDEAARESIDPTKLGELADDIAVNGLLQPIGARGPSPEGRYEIVWGHRRYLACRMLQLTELPARVCPWPTDPALARIAENFHRVDLNPREEARAVCALRGQGKPLAEIARILRRSIGWVETRVELMSWPQELQDAVARGDLPMNTARLLAEVDHDQYRTSLVEEVKRTGASAPIVSTWLAHYVADRERIIRNTETVEQIVTRREDFIVLFQCECCGDRKDTRESSLIRICRNCNATLAEERRNAATEAHQADHGGR
jgi:ParB/RepB/Spo0J family partition protein